MSLPTQRGPATASSAAPPTSPSAFGRIKQRLLDVIMSSRTIEYLVMSWRLRGLSKSSAPASPSIVVSGCSYTPTTPEDLSKAWDGAHLQSRYGIASAFDPRPDDEFRTTTFGSTPVLDRSPVVTCCQHVAFIPDSAPLCDCHFSKCGSL